MRGLKKGIGLALALLLCCGCAAEAASAAPEPEQNQLTVFSLGESGTVRRAVIEFQKENPAMTVRYQIGDQSPLPREETLRALHNELEKGRGPDVLILDGMEAAVYAGQQHLLFSGTKRVNFVVLETIGNSKMSFCQNGTTLFAPKPQNFLNAVALRFMRDA